MHIIKPVLVNNKQNSLVTCDTNESFNLDMKTKSNYHKEGREKLLYCRFYYFGKQQSETERTGSG